MRHPRSRFVHPKSLSMSYLTQLTGLGLFIAILSIGGCTPDQAKLEHSSERTGWNRLAAGNERFVANESIHPDQTLEDIQKMKEGQHPFAVVITCSDSRVPPELIFDQGLGDLFVVRNAGNLIDSYELGSVEYAVEHLHTPLIVVLGHSQCGAIKAYVDHPHDTIPNHIQHIVDYIKAEPEERALVHRGIDFYDRAIEANVMHGVHELQHSEPILAKHVRSGDLEIIGALYDLESGKVRLLEEQ